MKEILYKLNETKDKVALRIFENSSNVFEDLKKLNAFFNFLTYLINNFSKVVSNLQSQNILSGESKKLRIVFTPNFNLKY